MTKMRQILDKCYCVCRLYAQHAQQSVLCSAGSSQRRPGVYELIFVVKWEETGCCFLLKNTCTKMNSHVGPSLIMHLAWPSMCTLCTLVRFDKTSSSFEKKLNFKLYFILIELWAENVYQSSMFWLHLVAS